MGWCLTGLRACLSCLCGGVVGAWAGRGGTLSGFWGGAPWCLAAGSVPVGWVLVVWVGWL